MSCAKKFARIAYSWSSSRCSPGWSIFLISCGIPALQHQTELIVYEIMWRFAKWWLWMCARAWAVAPSLHPARVITPVMSPSFLGVLSRRVLCSSSSSRIWWTDSRLSRLPPLLSHLLASMACYCYCQAVWMCWVMVCVRWHGLSGGLRPAIPEFCVCLCPPPSSRMLCVEYVEDVQHLT